MTTIIERVRQALETAGENALFEELDGILKKIRANVDELTMHMHNGQHTIHQYIYLVQSRCHHDQWIRGEQAVDGASCWHCGLHVQHPELTAFIIRVYAERSNSWAYRVHGHATRFRLASNIRAKIQDQLVPERIHEPTPTSADGAAQQRDDTAPATPRGTTP